MNTPPSILVEAVDLIGLSKVARECGVTHQAVRKWTNKGRLPRTEWTGETDYAGAIARLSGGRYERRHFLVPADAANDPSATPPNVAAGEG